MIGECLYHILFFTVPVGPVQWDQESVCVYSTPMVEC